MVMVPLLWSLEWRVMRESSYEKQLPQCKGERFSDLKQSPGLVPRAKMKKPAVIAIDVQRGATFTHSCVP